MLKCLVSEAIFLKPVQEKSREEKQLLLFVLPAWLGRMEDPGWEGQLKSCLSAIQLTLFIKFVCHHPLIFFYPSGYVSSAFSI